MKILINTQYGGFGLSDEFLAVYPHLEDAERNNPALIEAVENFGLEEASDDYCTLEIVEIPDNRTDYIIKEYDGIETVLYVLNGKIYEE